jgi:hypothetical protein
VPDCYLGLRLDPGGGTEAAGVLVVAPAVLLHPLVPQPDGTVLYELVTGHPDRTAQELVFLADLAVELRAWPADTGPRSGWIRRRPPRRWSPAGSAASCRPAAGSADRPGGPGPGAAGHDLCARPACPPAAAPARPDLPAPLAAVQRPPGLRRPAVAADIRLWQELLAAAGSAAATDGPDCQSTRVAHGRQRTLRQVAAGTCCRSRPGCADGSAARGNARCLCAASAAGLGRGRVWGHVGLL